MRSHPFRLTGIVLALLVCAVAVPVLVAGTWDLQKAHEAIFEERYEDAMRLYESAARLLFWRRDLWEQAGLAAYRGQDMHNAVRLLEQARAGDSLSAQGWDILGAAHWKMEEREKALSVWLEGTSRQPAYPPLYEHLALVYHEAGEYDAEQKVLEQWLSIADAPPAHFRSGLLLMLSDIGRARAQFDLTSALDPEYASAAQTLIKTLDLAALEPDSARRLTILGRGLGLVEEWGLARKAFESAVQADEKNAEAWAWLGEARQHQGQDGSAELERALNLDADDPVVRGLRGLYWKRQDRYAEALKEYQQASRLEPGNPAWQVSMAEAYTRMGDLISALAAHQKATELAPEAADYWRLLSLFCSDNGVQVSEIGLPAARKAVDLAPNDARALDALGWAFANAGYLYNAELNLLKAIQLAPDLAIAHVHLAQTYLRKGDQASALNELNLARQLDPGGPAGELATQLLKQYFP